MELKQIFNIKGQPGLYTAVKKINGGFLAKSIKDGSKQRVTNQSAEAYCLADITLYGVNGSIPLRHVFQKMQQHAEPPVGEKEHVETVKNYFFTLLPELDTKRVFATDMRKVISWYNMLNGKVNFVTISDEQREAA